MTSNDWSLNERKDEYLKIEDILERFNEIDRLYNHTPWTLDQIYANLNIIMSEQFKSDDVVLSYDAYHELIADRAEKLKGEN